MPYNINLKHLECFIKVAQLGSINKAAQALFISQPHLGKIIHDLENEMGYLLLNRSNQGVTLTPEGEEFLKHAARVLEEMNCLRRPSIKTAEFNHLSVSMTKFSHVMESFIEVVLNHQDQPSFSHRLYEGNAEEVIDDVLSGRATGYFTLTASAAGRWKSFSPPSGWSTAVWPMWSPTSSSPKITPWCVSTSPLPCRPWLPTA